MANCPQCGKEMKAASVKRHIETIHGQRQSSTSNASESGVTEYGSGLRGELGKIDDIALTNERKAVELLSNYSRGRQNTRRQRDFATETQFGPVHLPHGKFISRDPVMVKARIALGLEDD